MQREGVSRIEVFYESDSGFLRGGDSLLILMQMGMGSECSMPILVPEGAVRI